MPRQSKRLAITAMATAVLLIAVAVTVWRVLRPSEVVTQARAASPTATVESFPSPGALGALASAPLIHDDRIRIFAKKREVWSDSPASYQYERSALWAYRRWPAQVTGVALMRLAPDNGVSSAVVVTAWTDGELVGLDAEMGTVLWRAQGDPLAEDYVGRRTGAMAIYQPPGLFMSGTRFVTVGEEAVRAFSAETGLPQWKALSPVTPECRGSDFSTLTQLYILDTCTATLRRLDLATGAELPSMRATVVEPLSCMVGHSQCTAMRTTHAGSTRGWRLTEDRDPADTPTLAAESSLPASGGTVIVPSSGEDSVAAVDLNTGATIWTWRPPSPGSTLRLLAADPVRTILLESNGDLVLLNTVTGKLLLSTSVLRQNEPGRSYDINMFYQSGAYLVLERTNPKVTSDEVDDAFYYTPRPVLLAYTGRI